MTVRERAVFYSLLVFRTVHFISIRNTFATSLEKSIQESLGGATWPTEPLLLVIVGIGTSLN